MTDAEWQELIDLDADHALPEALRARLETYLATAAAAAQDAATLIKTVECLHSAPAHHPQDWFVEQALEGLLRDHAQSVPLEPYWKDNTQH